MHQVDHHKNLIEIHHLSYSYNGQEDVLKDINLEVHQGDYIGFVGPNGAGKTTLLKLILKLLTPSQGTIKLFGQPLSEFSDWQKIGYVPQRISNFDANFPASVYEVVMMGRTSNKKLYLRIFLLNVSQIFE